MSDQLTSLYEEQFKKRVSIRYVLRVCGSYVIYVALTRAKAHTL